MVEHSGQIKIKYFDDHVREAGVGCHFSPSGSNAKNKNKSPMLKGVYQFYFGNPREYHGTAVRIHSHYRGRARDTESTT